MRVTVDVSGVRELQRRLAGFSDRRMGAALATALTRTAHDIRVDVQREMEAVFDRPTPYTLRSVRVKAAKAQRPEAEVFISEAKAARDPSPAVVLRPQVEGGARGTKGLELALHAMRALPSGWRVVPGQGARLDAYGNVSRGLVQQIVAQLRQVYVPTGPINARRYAKALRKTGGRYFVVKPGEKRQPGVYIADVVGRNVVPVFVFVSRANYRKRLDFYGVAQRRVAQSLGPQVRRAISDSLARMGSAQ